MKISIKKKMPTEKCENRHPIKQYFMTFSRWKTYDSLVELENLLPETTWIHIVQEDHDEPDKDELRGSMIHYHVSLVLKHEIPFKKMVKWIEKTFPNDYKRVKIEKTRNFDAALSYSKKESHIIHESGKRPSRVPMQKITRITLTQEQKEAELISLVKFCIDEDREFYEMKRYLMINHNLGWETNYTMNECRKFLHTMKYVKGR